MIPVKSSPWGVCASGEIRPTEGPEFDRINYRYGVHYKRPASRGGEPVGKYCYLGSQKRDDDETDITVAYLCEKIGDTAPAEVTAQDKEPDPEESLIDSDIESALSRIDKNADSEGASLAENIITKTIDLSTSGEVYQQCSEAVSQLQEEVQSQQAALEGATNDLLEAKKSQLAQVLQQCDELKTAAKNQTFGSQSNAAVLFDKKTNEYAQEITELTDNSIQKFTNEPGTLSVADSFLKKDEESRNRQIAGKSGKINSSFAANDSHIALGSHSSKFQATNTNKKSGGLLETANSTNSLNKSAKSSAGDPLKLEPIEIPAEALSMLDQILAEVDGTISKRKNLIEKILANTPDYVRKMYEENPEILDLLTTEELEKLAQGIRVDPAKGKIIDKLLAKHNISQEVLAKMREHRARPTNFGVRSLFQMISHQMKEKYSDLTILGSYGP